MSERNLSRRLATSIVDALKAQGHILVVKGGSAPLLRELDEQMTSQLDAIVARIVPREAVGGEVTSTFGDETADEAVEDLVAKLTRALFDSDHVEDVFAEDNVIQRDIFRVVRDTLLQPEVLEQDDEDELPIRVRLDTLGYVASTVGKLASGPMIREALERAAEDVDAQLASYNPQGREATFLLEGGGPDRRLELEEAVADQLSDMVDTGLVELPTIERVFTISRETSPRERTAVRQRVELAAAKTIMRSGCAATWEFTDPHTIKVTFTPLSEHDAGDVDQYMPQFVRDVAAIFSRPAITDSVETLRLTPSSTPPPKPPEEEPVKAPAKLAKEPKVTARGEEPAAPRTKEPARKAASPPKEPARKTASPPKEPARKAASPPKEPARKAASPPKEPTAARATTKRATTADKTTAKKAPAVTREAAPRATAKAAKTAKTTAKKR